MTNDVNTQISEQARIYSSGLIHSSVCAPSDWTKDDVEVWMNVQSPTGIDSRWEVREEAFRTGEPNPTPCNQSGGKHWLLTC